MSEKCGEPHPEDAKRLCAMKGTHADHLDLRHPTEPWPNVEVQRQMSLRKTNGTKRSRSSRKSDLTHVAAAIVGARLGSGETKAEGMDRALAATPDQFKASFYAALKHVASQQESLTSDDVRRVLDEQGIVAENPTAIGPLMPYGAKQGWTAKTDERSVSSRGEGKGRDGLTVWRSLIFVP